MNCDVYDAHDASLNRHTFLCARCKLLLSKDDKWYYKLGFYMTISDVVHKIMTYFLAF